MDKSDRYHLSLVYKVEFTNTETNQHPLAPPHLFGGIPAAMQDLNLNMDYTKYTPSEGLSPI